MVKPGIPRIVIAGTQSGAGKTSITLGLVAALRRRGLRVQTFKVGPDYLDPTYLARASGRPCYNLDSWMTGEDYVRDLVCKVCGDADLAVVEGVMGLFDGADPASLEGSTAQVALWLDAPVALVVDAHGMSRSFAAIVHGFSSFAPGLRIGGVIANRCGSPRHGQWLAESLKAASLPPLFGAVSRGALPELRSRHLGLVNADAEVLPEETLGHLADAISGAIDLDGILQLATSAGTLERLLNEERAPQSRPVRLGLARDEAFQFYYPDNLNALQEAGCELVPFSPLHDSMLPAGLDGLYFGGGYPEEHAGELAANEGMLATIRDFARRGGAIYAECGGLMYLSQGIETLDGNQHRLLGILPAWTRMRPRRQKLGYVEITLTRDSLLGRIGQRLRGHEFHYSELTSLPEEWARAYEVRYRRSEQTVAEGFQHGRILASYVHFHFASQPGVVEHFVNFLRES